MRSVWLFVSRFLITALTLLPTWLAYAIPFVRMRRGATIADERWTELHRKHAPRFYRLAVRMRGGLIKVGQILSTRVDILPIEWTSTLSDLQDRVDPLPWLELEPHVRRAYGRSPHEVFEVIDEKPAAAASFGQVHRARTPEGEEVALKIRYPDAEQKLAIDLWTLKIFLPLFGVFAPDLPLRPIYQEVSRALRTELDYEQEARFTEIIHENFKGVPRIHIPRVLREYTRRDVICTTWFEGRKITDPAFLADPAVDRRALLELVIECWIKMMYVDGVFQSDPHPGNLLARVAPDGQPELCVVDFGQVKILTRAFHQTLVRSVMAFVTRDVDQFLGTLEELGLFGAAEVARARPLIAKILERYATMSPDQTRAMDFTWIRTEVLGQIQSFKGVTVPTDLVLYGRTFALLAGLSRAIDPSVDAFALAKPHFLRAVLAGGPPE